jgi:hypothetical protein
MASFPPNVTSRHTEEAPEGGLPEGGLCGNPLVSCSEAAQPKGTEADGTKDQAKRSAARSRAQ